MKRAIISLLICITLVFTITVPSYADTVYDNPYDSEQIVYLAIGDSIGAGCKNWDYVYSMDYITKKYQGEEFKEYREYCEDFLEYNAFDKGVKNKDVYAVEHSYVSRLAQELNADPVKSTNFTYNGMRFKDICHVLDIKEVTEGDYDNDTWRYILDYASGFDGSEYQFEYLFNNSENAEILNTAISTSDIITVELGENDLSSLIYNKEVFGKLMDIFFELVNAEDDIKPFLPFIKDTKVLIEKISQRDNSDYQELIDEKLKEYDLTLKEKQSVCVCDDISEILRAIERDLEDISKITPNFYEFINAVVDSMGYFLVQNQYYFRSLMEYINDNKRDDAIVIVSTMINPYRYEDLGLISLTLEMLINGMNRLIKAEACRYNYYVVDISDVNLNPKADKNGVKYEMHPNGKDQQKIADRFLRKIRQVECCRG